VLPPYFGGTRASKRRWHSVGIDFTATTSVVISNEVSRFGKKGEYHLMAEVAVQGAAI